jgi:multidrug resistance efflux pump
MKPHMHFAPLLLLAACASHELRPTEADPTAASGKAAPVEESHDLSCVAVINSRNTEVIHTEADGAIMKLNVHDDEYVHKGDSIAQLDVSELRAKLNQAKGQRSRAEGEAGRAAAQRAQAQRKVRLEGRLMRGGVSSPESFHAAETDVASTGAEEGAAGGDIEAANANITEYERLIAAANIQAPMDGIVSGIKFHDGEVAHKGLTLARVFDPTDLQIKMMLPRAHRDAIKIGDHVELVYNGEHKLPATVAQIIDANDPAIDFVTVVAEIDKSANRPDDIHVGISGHVRIADKGAAR